MTPQWDDLNARARGLSTHLLTGPQLAALAHEPDHAALSDALRRAGILTATDVEYPGPAQVEIGIRRWAASLLGTLARWSGPRAAALPLVFDEEDTRSVQALLRGAIQHAAPDDRLAGLIPTPALPERALQELSHAHSAADVAVTLVAWRHPFGAPILEPAAGEHPDILTLEVALTRAAAARAVDAARRSHDRSLRDWVRSTIDLANVRIALLLALGTADVPAAAAFIGGGRLVPRAAFEQATGTRDLLRAAVLLAACFAPDSCADVIRRSGAGLDLLEDGLFDCRMRQLAHAVRREPLGPLALLRFALRLRGQVVALQRIVWTMALAAPAPAAATASAR